jgi:hypothetical protein
LSVDACSPGSYDHLMSEYQLRITAMRGGDCIVIFSLRPIPSVDGLYGRVVWL